MTKFNSAANQIMFIDDNEVDQFVYVQLLTKFFSTGKLRVFKTARHALDYLAMCIKNKDIFPNNLPDMIFLDPALPVMDGFDFLEEFEPINKAMDYKIRVVILTCSLDPTYAKKCMDYKSVIKFLDKPLRKAHLLELGMKVKPMLN